MSPSSAPALPEVELEPGTLVIGDLHLDLEAPRSLEKFRSWLEAARSSAPRLVILGDLFEYWIGPLHAETEGGRLALEALRAFGSEGARVDVIPGNRDFLLDERFERESGCTLRRDGLIGCGPDGQRVLFVHGDELCTLDRNYQRMRRVLRSGPLTWLAPRMPRILAQSIAKRLRRVSKRAVASKPRAETELQGSACAALVAEYGANTLVCGHAHRFRDEPVGGARWLVVDAFGGTRDTLVVEDSGELQPRGGGAG